MKATESLTHFASQHHGLFRVDDARRCGVTEEQLRTLVGAGWCDRTGRGVYRIAGAPRSDRQAFLAAVWFNGPEAVASHRAAGSIWGMPGCKSAEPEATRPRGESQRKRNGVLHTCLVLPDVHRRVEDGIPVTSPARTVFDLAGVVHPLAAERALDFALSRKLCTIRQVHQAFFSLARRGRRGTATMRALLEVRGEGYVPPASELERRARELYDAVGIPMPRFEVDLGDEDWIGRVDCLWDGPRVIVELDGRAFHGTFSARRRDRERDNRMMAAGWRVIRVTWEDLTKRPEVVEGWIRRALAGAA